MSRDRLTWGEAWGLQRRLAEWVEPWDCAGTGEVWRDVEDGGRVRREHLAWFANARVARLVCDLHNAAMVVLNALLMYRKGEADSKAVMREERRENVQETDEAEHEHDC